MGFNTALIFLNDALPDLENDPRAGRKIAEMIQGVAFHNSDGTYGTSLGRHANPIACLPPQHADTTQIVAIGGNRIQKLGYGWWSQEPEQLLRGLADQMGYRLVKKAEKA